MAEHTVTIVVKKGGKVTSEVEGIAGPSCVIKTAWFDRLGREVEHEDTDEMYLTETVEENETESVGTGESYDW